MIKVEIDEGSGFCFGVVTAIHKAEEELAKGETLYCLGDIVHNSREVDRLKTMGLITINREEFKQLKNAKVLLRAHGEPPETYMIARENNIEIIDATCPVVLRLQKRIRQGYLADSDEEKQIVIYGKHNAVANDAHTAERMARGCGNGKGQTGFCNSHAVFKIDVRRIKSLIPVCRIRQAAVPNAKHRRVFSAHIDLGPGQLLDFVQS